MPIWQVAGPSRNNTPVEGKKTRVSIGMGQASSQQAAHKGREVLFVKDFPLRAALQPKGWPMAGPGVE